MSGTKTSRADLKNRFKKGMYPTEGDFANVFESYVHKDDDISMSKVVLTDGDGNTTTLNNVIGNKADKTDLTEITNRLTTAENDIDTAEDNIDGHETRIKSLEAFKERVRAFLEDADTSDETINRWHEIESFLQGITDTQTLTGLLADLKQEILASIPEPQTGNYLKLVPDLDAYTDAPDGEIVKYTGPTTDQYTHGWDYERKAGIAQQELVASSWPSTGVYESRIDVPASANILTGNVSLTMTSTDKTITIYRDSNTVLVEGNRNIGDIIWSEGYSDTITQSSETNSTITVKGTYYQYPRDFQKSNNEVLTVFREQSTGLLMAPFAADGAPDAFCFIGLSEDLAPIFITRASSVDMGESQSSASWQLCPSMPVIQ